MRKSRRRNPSDYLQAMSPEPIQQIASSSAQPEAVGLLWWRPPPQLVENLSDREKLFLLKERMPYSITEHNEELNYVHLGIKDPVRYKIHRCSFKEYLEKHDPEFYRKYAFLF